MNSRILASWILFCLLALPSRGLAQCETWLAGPLDDGILQNGSDGNIFAALSWDPDGAGPLLERLVVGGDFSSIGGVAAQNIAYYDPGLDQWLPFGPGISAQVNALTVFNGQVVAGCRGDDNSGTFDHTVRRWNGTSWINFPATNTGSVTTLAVHDGVLYIGGNFATNFVDQSSNPAAYLAAYNPVSNLWFAIESAGLGTFANGTVGAMASYNGSLYVGGNRSSNLSITGNAVHIAYGSAGGAWTTITDGTDPGSIQDFSVFSGELIIAGGFNELNGVVCKNVAGWNGSSVHAFHTGVASPVGEPSTIFAAEVFDGIVIGGDFETASSFLVNGAARWAPGGSQWQAMGSGTDGRIFDYAYYRGKLVAVGSFTQATYPANNIAIWDGVNWSALGGGSAQVVNALVPFNGRMVAAGSFQQPTFSLGTANYIVGWNGNTTTPFGSGMSSPIHALESFKYPGAFGSYELIAGGTFTTAGGVTALRIARWNEDPIVAFPPPAWAPMGAGFNSNVNVIERASGFTYAGGIFTFSGINPVSRIARWNETTDVWEALGSGMNGAVNAIKEFNGQLYVGGAFTTAGGVSTGGLARWNGSSWSQVGGFFLGTVYALEVHNGELYIGGLFPGLANGANIAKYNGSSYSNVGSGGTNATVYSLFSSAGRLYMGGDFSLVGNGSVAANRVAYWDGVQWHQPLSGADNTVRSFGRFATETHVGGLFTAVGGGTLVTPRWARLNETGLPWFGLNPSSKSVDLHDDTIFSAALYGGYSGVSYQWLHDDQPMIDGPGPDGSFYSGVNSEVLTISDVAASDAGTYRLTATNACGTVTTSTATLTVVVPEPFTDVTQSPLDDMGAGSGASWGDFDDDGYLDLHVVNSVGANRLFRNSSGGSFVSIAEAFGIFEFGDSRAAAWADYDNDGDLDFYLANYATPNRLYVNANGTYFSANVAGPLGDSGPATGSVWGDYDNDGDVDLYLVNDGTPNKLLRNDGAGVFVDVTSGPLGDAGNGRSAAWGDYDDDGDLDLYVANATSGNLLLRNEGGGAFVDATTGPLGDTSSSQAVDWGDYDNDGDLDLYIVNSGTANRLLRNDSGGTFVDVTVGLLGDTSAGKGVAWGDYDNDGDLDLFLASSAGASKLLRNDGDGTFADATTAVLSAGGSDVSGAWGDYDNDGDLDLYIVSSAASNRLIRNDVGTENHWLHVNLQGVLSNWSGIGARVRVEAGGVTRVVEISGGSSAGSQNSLTAEFGLGASTVIDLLEVRWPSGIVQVVTPVPAVDQAITVMEPTDFVDVTAGPLIGSTNSNTVAWGDYDSDGDLDLYLATWSDNQLLRNDGGTFVNATAGPLGNASLTFSASWGDYDNDGDLDLFFPSMFSSPERLLRNDGGGVFAQVTGSALSVLTNSLVGIFGDYDNDGDLDIYVVNGSEPNRLLRNDGGDVFVDATSGPLGAVGTGGGAAWGDYDSDGDLDLFVANSGSSNKLYRNDGGGTFVDATSGPLGYVGNSSAPTWGDYDNDGDLDLYVVVWNAANLLLRNDGGGVFVDVASGPVADTGPGVDADWGDFDNDGFLDLYLTNNGAPNKLLRNDGSGSFEDATTYPLGDARESTGMAWGDYDGDGDLDLYYTNFSQPNVLLRNDIGNQNHWLHVNLEGAISNRSGIGARVRVVAGGISRMVEVSGGSGYGSQNSLTAEFGLGAATTIDLVEVTWPSGIVQVVLPIPAVDQVIDVLEPTTDFVDRTAGPLGDIGWGHAAAWGDYDGDGDLDLYFTNIFSANKLLRNDEGVFSDATVAPVGGADASTGVAWADYDNDGDLDLYVASLDLPNRLFRNNGGVFVDVTSGPLGIVVPSAGVAWGDYDGDGDLDLYVANVNAANKLLRNDGGDVFADVTSGPLGDTGPGYGVAWADYDNDGDLDLYVANEGTSNKLLRNDAGTFVDATSGPLGDTGYSIGVAWGDYDNDGDLDLYVTNNNTPNKLFRNDGGGAFADVTSGPLGDSGSGRGVAWADYDNDGDLDLYVANAGSASKLLRNDGGGTFVDDTSGPMGEVASNAGAAWGDYDDDGDLDLYVLNTQGANKLLRNEIGNMNHWLQVNLQGTSSNRSGVGARVRVVAGGISQIQEVSGGSGQGSQNSLTAEFGLGSTTTIDLVEVQWPSGVVQVLSPVPTVDARILVVEASPTSVDPVAPRPLAYRLHGAMPNPFNPSTTIRFELPRPEAIELTIYDLAGRRVRVLESGHKEAGIHEVVWRGLDDQGVQVASGVYLYELRAGGDVRTQRMTLVK